MSMQSEIEEQKSLWVTYMPVPQRRNQIYPAGRNTKSKVYSLLSFSSSFLSLSLCHLRNGRAHHVHQSFSSYYFRVLLLCLYFFRSFFLFLSLLQFLRQFIKSTIFRCLFFPIIHLFLKSVGMTTTTAAAMMTRNIDYGTTCTCISLCDIVLFIISCTFVPYVLISNRMFHFQFCAQNLMCMLMICEELNITVKKQHV